MLAIIAKSSFILGDTYYFLIIICLCEFRNHKFKYETLIILRSTKSDLNIKISKNKHA